MPHAPLVAPHAFCTPPPPARASTDGLRRAAAPEHRGPFPIDRGTRGGLVVRHGGSKGPGGGVTAEHTPLPNRSPPVR